MHILWGWVYKKETKTLVRKTTERKIHMSWEPSLRPLDTWLTNGCRWRTWCPKIGTGNRSLLLAQYQRQGSGCIQNCLRKNSKPWVWLNWKEDRDLLIMSAMGKFEDSGRNYSESLTSLGMIPLSDNKKCGLPSEVVEETPPLRGK